MAADQTKSLFPLSAQVTMWPMRLAAMCGVPLEEKTWQQSVSVLHGGCAQMDKEDEIMRGQDRP